MLVLDTNVSPKELPADRQPRLPEPDEAGRAQGHSIVFLLFSIVSIVCMVSEPSGAPGHSIVFL